MKLAPIGDCEDCPFFNWYDITYNLECGKSLKQIRYKEIGSDKAIKELFNQCPLDNAGELEHEIELLEKEDARLCRVISELYVTINNQKDDISYLKRIIDKQKKLIGVLYETIGVDD